MKTICFTGHRPDKLGSYDWNTPKNQRIMEKLKEQIEQEIIHNNVKTFIFGVALGIDQMAFEIVKKIQEYSRYGHDIKMILAIPFEKQASKWFNKNDIDRYNAQKEWADEVIYVDTVDGYEFKGVAVGEYHPAKMMIRNKFMVNNSDKIIAVWNGSKGGTANAVNYAKKIGKEIIVINPDEI